MYNTDKSELLKEYEELFADLKEEPIKYLEIGIWEGGSLLWAKDFFPKGEIVGIDLKLPATKDKRIKMHICDQNDYGKLREIAKDKFDIIIDDGSHLREETKTCFYTLWEYLEEGGWYIIEDWDAYLVAPQFIGMTDFVQDLLRFDCKKKIYFKNEKAYAAFQK